MLEVRPSRVVVYVQGGVVQDVHVPLGVEVVVWDYDTEGCDPDRLRTDSDGGSYVESIWRHVE